MAVSSADSFRWLLACAATAVVVLLLSRPLLAVAAEGSNKSSSDCNWNACSDMVRECGRVEGEEERANDDRGGSSSGGINGEEDAAEEEEG